MPVRPKHWDRRRYPHPNIVAVPVVMPKDAVVASGGARDWFATAVAFSGLATGAEIPLVNQQAAASAGRVCLTVESTGSTNPTGVVIHLYGEDQFGDARDEAITVTGLASFVSANVYSRLTMIRVDDLGTPGGRTLSIGNRGIGGVKYALPVRISSDTYGAGGEVLAIVDRLGLSVADAQVSLDAKNNAMKRDSGTWADGIHHVFFDFDKVAAF